MPLSKEFLSSYRKATQQDLRRVFELLRSNPHVVFVIEDEKEENPELRQAREFVASISEIRNDATGSFLVGVGQRNGKETHLRIMQNSSIELRVPGDDHAGEWYRPNPNNSVLYIPK